MPPEPPLVVVKLHTSPVVVPEVVPDGHSLWPSFTNVPCEFLESYFPLRIDVYESITDSGGPGLHRGGNGISTGYRFLEPGEISIHDDRWLTYPWGVNGGLPGGRSNKLMVDRQTRSLWNQFTGQPVVGALAGTGVELKVRPAGAGHIRFEVRDTGIGLNTATLSELLKPFSREDASNTGVFV